MNYYPHHIGDYTKNTAHLSMLEDGAYRRLIDMYYTREKPLPLDMQTVYRLARARTKQERIAIDAVLQEFFINTDFGFLHSRCEKEITNAQSRISAAQKNGTKGGRPKGHGLQEDSGSEENNPLGSDVNPNGLSMGYGNETQEKAHQSQKPKANNHKPIKTPLSPQAGKDDGFELFWNVYPKKVGKVAAQKAWLNTGLNQIDAEIVLNALGWQSKSEQWLKDNGQFIPNPATYLNQKRWMDEPQSESNTPRPARFDPSEYLRGMHKQQAQCNVIDITPSQSTLDDVNDHGNNDQGIRHL